MIRYFRTARAMHTPSMAVRPKNHEEANDAQFEQLLTECDDVELLRSMCRRLRADWQAMKWAAEINADTIKSMWRSRE